MADRASQMVPRCDLWEASHSSFRTKCLILLVGAPRFELGTPSPPDWCANRAALRSDRENPLKIAGFSTYRLRLGIAIVENRRRKVPKSAHRVPKYSRSPFTFSFCRRTASSIAAPFAFVRETHRNHAACSRRRPSNQRRCAFAALISVHVTRL